MQCLKIDCLNFNGTGNQSSRMSHHQAFYDEHKTLTQILAKLDSALQQLTQLGFSSSRPSQDIYPMKGLRDQIHVIENRLLVIEAMVCIHTMSYVSHGDGEGHFACTKCDHTSCCG
jgi:hypothetical protein